MDKIDEYCQSISENQQRTDLILSDLYHEIENDDLNDNQLAIFGREIKKYRNIRRGYDNANIIRNVYEKHKEKIFLKQNRPFFRNSIRQVMSDLSQPYKNRVLTDEDIQNMKTLILDASKEKKEPQVRKGSRLNEDDIEKLKELYQQGKSQTDIAKILGVKQPSVNYQIKKLKEKGEI